MSTPTTQAAGTPAASAAGNIVVATSATTRSSLASTSVVTPTVTTPSSPKRTMSLGDYKKTRGNMVLARDELEALFDVGSDADMEDGEEEDEVPSSSTRVDPNVGSCRPREDDSDASGSMRSRSGSDRPLADAGPLSSPRISTHCGIIDDVTKELGFDPATDQRRDYSIGLFHELRWYGNKKTSRRSRVPEWQALCQSWGAFVENFNKDPVGCHERVRLARERYERFSKRPMIDRLRWGAIEAGIPCAVPMGIECEHCHVGAVRVSERDINGYTGVRVPEEVKTLRTNLIAQMSSSGAGGRSTLSRTVCDYSCRSSFTPFGGFGGGGLRTPSPFPERPASGRSSAPTYRGSEEILSNEYENDQDPGSGSDDLQFAGRSSELPPVRLAVGVEAAGRRRGSGPPDSVDRLEAVERLQTAEFAVLQQELTLLKAQIAQVSQTASNVQVDLWSKLVVLRTRVGALEQASAPSHQA
ncbi:unnamed protein product [Phytophthora fragariaefolia]|uniref:Unnamed protein product n=1 Tax=Phytophthora fragariaefolia TaxID=1490495 RepID=A0A9W7D217_9STRA|nr:unnamed protein product [Phytophthora fragariaefolia]